MRKVKLLFIFLCSLGIVGYSQSSKLPEGFVYVKEMIPSIKVELRYYSTNNFVGDTIDGYRSNRLILTKSAADGLLKVQRDLNQNELGLLVYDGYRPQIAVNNFVTWARRLNDTINKSSFYPNVKKSKLFKKGYIASKSGHSRGSTIDLTIVNLKTGKPLDMGSPYDFFGPESWVAYDNLTDLQKRNRELLQNIMFKYGFRNYPKEWWHFTLRNEPFPKTYFDFPIE